MHGILKQKITFRALGVSSSMILAKSLKGIRTMVPTPRSYMHDVTRGRGVLACEREFKHLSGISGYLLLGDPASSNKMRGETLNNKFRRQFSSFEGLPAEERFLLKNAVELGSKPQEISFASAEGQQIMAEADREGSAEGLLDLRISFRAGLLPGLYGLGSISCVMNAIDTALGRTWNCRGHLDFLLDTCDSVEKVTADGLTFGKLAFLAFSNGAKVEVFRGNQCTIDNFREHVFKCATSMDTYMISVFDRARFKLSYGSHVTPIGAYHAGRDLVYLLDVSDSIYRSFWIPLTFLWEAMTSIDKASGNNTGFMVLSSPPNDICMRYTLSCRDGSWMRTANHLLQIPLLLKSEDVKDVDGILSVLLGSESTNFREFIKHVAEVNGQNDGNLWPRKKERKMLAIQEQLLRQLHETQLYSRVSRWLDYVNCGAGIAASYSRNHALPVIEANMAPHVPMQSTMKTGSSGRFLFTDSANCSKANLAGPDALTMLLFALPSHMWSGIREPKLSAEFNSLVSIDSFPQMLKNEVLGIRQQFEFLTIDLDRDTSDLEVLAN